MSRLQTQSLSPQSSMFYLEGKIELRDSPRLSLVVSDFVQLDSISVRKSERRAGFLYNYLYIVIPSHVEVIYQDDILLPVAVTGDIDRKSRLPVFHICRHLDSRSKETPPSVFMLKKKIPYCYIRCKGYLMDTNSMLHAL